VSVRKLVGQPGGRTPAPAPLDLIQDFVNTEIPEWQVDELASPAQLLGWLRQRDLLEADAVVGAEEFLLAREVRAALRALALNNTVGTHAHHSRAPVDAAFAHVPLRLAARDDGRPRLVASGEGVERALGTLLVIAHEAEREGTWPRMKACRKESCGWLFYDYSRNRSGSWCSMSICGNRVKTRRYRARKRSSP
jgi:predicted RNA-binding Zn ribbon-like protein